MRGRHGKEIDFTYACGSPKATCDLFAEQLASVDGFPPFEKYWSLKERDQAINATIKFISEHHDELASMAAKKRKREWWKHE